MRLFLVRHGETRHNREGRVLGRAAHGLTDMGRRQATAAVTALSGESITTLYSSPLSRARETAEVIGTKLGLAVHVAEALAEVDAGELEGLTSQEMRARFPEFMALWDRDPGAAPMPGGESLAHVQERVWRWVRSLLDKHPEEKVAAVSHNFPIETLVCQVLDLPLAAFRNLRVDLGSVSAVDFHQDHGRLVRLNDLCHIAALEGKAGAATPLLER